MLISKISWGKSGADWGKSGVKIELSKIPGKINSSSKSPETSNGPVPLWSQTLMITSDHNWPQTLLIGILDWPHKLTSRFVMSLFYWAARHYSTLVLSLLAELSGCMHAVLLINHPSKNTRQQDWFYTVMLKYSTGLVRQLFEILKFLSFTRANELVR